ncbi:MAG: hypothetical protein IJU95_08135 [Treponema sp.]|nr:hypothetical protein [Treponema sp.]
MRKISILALIMLFAVAPLSFADDILGFCGIPFGTSMERALDLMEANGWSHNQTNKDLGSVSFTGGKYGGMKGGKIELRFQNDKFYLGLFDLKYNSGTEAEMNSLNHEQDIIEKYGLMLTEESEIMPVSLYTCRNGNTVAITRFSLGDKLPSIYMIVFTEGKDD